MSAEERAVLIGLFRQGNDYAVIGAIFGISGVYVKQIVSNYLTQKDKK